MGKGASALGLYEAILQAPLFAPATKWTSRSIAAQLGVSQSTVARVWREAFGAGVTECWREEPSTSMLRLCAALICSENSILVFEEVAQRRPSLEDPSSFMRAALRPHVQALLAADLVVPAENREAGEITVEITAKFLRGAVTARTSRADVVVVSKRRCALPGRTQSAAVVRAVVVDEADWQAQLFQLSSRIDPRTAPRLADAHVALRRWARDPYPPFQWIWQEPFADSGKHHTVVRQPSLTRSLGDAAALVMHEAIAHGQAGPKHRFTETFLASELQTSRRRVRDALRLLAGEGLVDLDTRGRAAIPLPVPEDVLETYAARTALGSLIVWRLAGSKSRTSAQIVQEFDRLTEVTAAGDVYAAGAADLDFQDALARMTHMRRIPTMFLGLSTQLRLFIAVLGLSYEFSPDQIVADNRRLVEAIVRKDATAAVAAWRSKVNGAVSYMLDTLPDPVPEDLNLNMTGYLRQDRLRTGSVTHVS